MKDFTVKVPGVDFKISSNQIYHIREVADKRAPDGFQKAGISKHPLPNIAEGIIVPYHGPTRTWDTGFFEGSACIVKDPMGKEILKTVKSVFLPELQLLMEGDLTNGKESNNKFFDEFTPFNGVGYGEDTSKYKIKGGNMFDTSKPLELLGLWWALIGKQLLPPNSNMTGVCSFILEDKKQSTSIEQDKEFDKTIATNTVLTIVNSKDKKDIKNLQNVLEYVGLTVDLEITELRPLLSIFNKWAVKGGYNNENATDFNNTYEKFQDEKYKEELVAYIKLIRDIKSGKVKVERTEIFIGGTKLGSDKKQAARRIVADQELYKEFLLIQ
jgi:hypothetical protein